MKLDIGELGDPVDALATFSPAPLMECAGRLYPGVDPASPDFEAAADAVARDGGAGAGRMGRPRRRHSRPARRRGVPSRWRRGALDRA
jgi:hypothetical protein